MKSFFQLSFIPKNSDLALLFLRLWLGISMLVLHGWPKLQNLVNGKHKFADPLGIGEFPSLISAVGVEVVGSVFLILGLFGRMASLFLAGTMAVAFGITHQLKLSGEDSGELAFLYLAGYLVILIAGSGKYSATPQG